MRVTRLFKEEVGSFAEVSCSGKRVVNVPLTEHETAICESIFSFTAEGKHNVMVGERNRFQRLCEGITKRVFNKERQ